MRIPGENHICKRRFRLRNLLLICDIFANLLTAKRLMRIMESEFANVSQISSDCYKFESREERLGLNGWELGVNSP